MKIILVLKLFFLHLSISGFKKISISNGNLMILEKYPLLLAEDLATLI